MITMLRSTISSSSSSSRGYECWFNSGIAAAGHTPEKQHQPAHAAALLKAVKNIADTA